MFLVFYQKHMFNEEVEKRGLAIVSLTIEVFRKNFNQEYVENQIVFLAVISSFVS